ncbi:MAG TPA: SDR family oxidoreductase [Solirubrobacterales bacterium]|jgi:3-oxoacyl-[acyl-carrier protein] reductase|nr:SDR family oxidoreductase [Solirubrobacterales bacterium]
MAQWNDGRRFGGKVALVTGAGGALGGAVARALGREGATVALGYRSSEDSARAALEEIEGAGSSGHVGQIEVTDSEAVDRFVAEAAERYGRIDVVVNAAGRIDPEDAVRFAESKDDAFATLLDVDLLGTFRVCQAAVPHLQRTGNGAIVNFSGSYGNGIDQENVVNSVAVTYCAAKGGVRALTSALARDLAPEIRVNAVAPGPIAANWEDDWEIPKEHIDEALAMTPLGRMGKPEEIAETVLYLASDGGGYTTGQVLEVSGGWILDG